MLFCDVISARPPESVIVRALALVCGIALALATLVSTTAAKGHTRLLIPNVRVSHDQYLAHSEPALAENPRNPNDLIAASKMFTDPDHYQFKIGTYYSKNGGRSWHDSGFLPGFDQYALVSDVSIAFSADGTAYIAVLAVAGNTSGIFVSRSNDGGETFSDPVPVFVDTTGTVFNDKPWVTVDQTTGPYRGTVYVAWNLDGPSAERDDPGGIRPRASADSLSGIGVARSTDGGQTFSAPIVVAPFVQKHFYLGAIPAVAPDGSLYVVYASFHGDQGINAMAMSVSHDGGQTFSGPDVVQRHVVSLPNHLRHSSFRNTSMPAFAIAPGDGSMVVSWADYRHGDADILASSSRDGGKTWSPAVRVNHDPVGDGKDQFEPALAVSPHGTYTCAWFDRRWDPHDRLIDEAVAQSTNDGASFGTALRVTGHSWNAAIDAPRPEGKASNTFIGDYQALAVDNHTVHPLWNDTQNGVSQEIQTASIAPHLFRR